MATDDLISCALLLVQAKSVLVHHASTLTGHDYDCHVVPFFGGFVVADEFLNKKRRRENEGKISTRIYFWPVFGS